MASGEWDRPVSSCEEGLVSPGVGVGLCAEESLPPTLVNTWNHGTALTSTPDRADFVCECLNPESDKGVCLHQAPGLLGPRQFLALRLRC